MDNALKINITDAARTRIEALVGSECIRLSIKSTGCSGHSYVLSRTENTGPNDDIILVGTAQLAIEKTTSWMMINMTIDYVETDLAQEFIFSNPNEKGRCGCGESFAL